MSGPDRQSEDAVFWDRLEEMPFMEAEHECVLRREQLSLEIAMLHNERAKINPPIGKQQKQEFTDMGSAMAENMAQLTKINERIKYLRKLQARVEWKEAVRALFGDEGVEQCIIYIEHRFSELRQMRRELI